MRRSRTLDGDDRNLYGAITSKVWSSVLPTFLPIYALAIYLSSLSGVELGRMNDLGLVSVLPVLTFVSLAILTVSFGLAVRRPSVQAPLLTMHVTVLIFMMYGITALVEEVPRFTVVWRHVGVTDYIVRTGAVDRSIDAYFNWPGFFILSAFVTEASGIPSLIGLLSWFPLLVNLLYMGPLLMILSTLTGDRRLIWLAIWLFYATNWIGQDYFSPQGLHYFLYLVIFAVLVKWFRRTRDWSSTREPRQRRVPFPFVKTSAVRWWLAPLDAPNTPSQPWQRVGLMAIIIVLFAVMVASHQLTPFMVLAAITALFMFDRTAARGLLVLMVVLTSAWITFMAAPYLSGHLTNLTSPVGKVDSAVAANVSNRLGGTAQHVIVVYTRMVMSVTIWGLAFLGCIRSLLRGYWDLTYALLAAAPFPLIVVQPYGGEMLLRVYLFALPFMVFFAAALFYTGPSVGRSWITTVMTVLVSASFIVGFLVARYGNERMDFFTPQEVEAVEHLYSIAEPDALLLVGTTNMPWQHKGYELYDYASLTKKLGGQSVIPTETAVVEVEQFMREANGKHPNSYLLITRSQKASAEILGDFPQGWMDTLEKSLIRSPNFEVIYSNQDGKIFVLEESSDRNGR